MRYCFTTLTRAREQARQIVCANNQRQILLAMFMYANDNHGVLPMATDSGQNGTTLDQPNSVAIFQGYRVGDLGPYHWDVGTLWPYVGSRDLKVRERLLNCPSDDSGLRLIYGYPAPIQGRNYSYTFNEQLDGMQNGHYNPNNSTLATALGYGCRLTQVKGADHKIFIVEEENPEFEECHLFAMMVTLPSYPHPLTTSRHSGFGNMGMGDGHVEHLSPDDLPPATKVLSVGQANASPAVKWHYWCDFTRLQ